MGKRLNFSERLWLSVGNNQRNLLPKFFHFPPPDELLPRVITFTVLQELNDVLYDTISQHNHMLSLKGKQKIKFCVVVVVANDTTLNKMRRAISL